MKVKDIVYYAAILCGKEDFAKVVSKGLVPDDNDDAVKMLNCYNLTMMELSEEVEPLIFSENITSTDGKYYYGDFSKTPKKVTDVCVNGVKAPFTVYPRYLESAAGGIEVTYEYRFFNASSLDDDCPYDGILSCRLLAFGVAAEYMLHAGLFEEARSLRTRYEEAVESREIKKRRVVKARTWA